MNQDKILFAIALLLISISARAQTQDITGLWYSQDSTRIYKIEESSGVYEARLFSSKRKNEEPGFVVLKNVKFRENKTRFEGIIFAVKDNTAATAFITLQDGIMQLRLQRFFVDHQTIRWYKVVD
jgi:hypothetical protein